MSFRTHCSLGILMLSSWGHFASAQTGEFSGLVRDPSLSPLPGATITAIRKNTGVARSTQSNRRGYYNISFLQPGEYHLRVQAAGFKMIEQPGVTLEVAERVRLDFTLQIATRNEVTTINGAALGIQTESPVVGTTVDRGFVANLPLNGRTFQSLIALAPGVVLTPGDGQFSVNGQRDDGNYFTVDGVSANVGISAFRSLEETAGGTVPAFDALGATSNLVSIDAMQEFRLQTSTYSAEFGRASGGQVQIVTRSGTNEFHGGLFDYFRNDALDANDWFAHARMTSAAFLADPSSEIRHSCFCPTKDYSCASHNLPRSMSPH
jgi:Carboxypeptidase regulatory-like domain